MRYQDATVITNLKMPVVGLVALVELDFSTGFVRLNSSPYTYSVFGHDFVGAGHLGSISSIQDGGDLSPKQVTLKLSGVPKEYTSLCLKDAYFWRPAKIWVATLDQYHRIDGEPQIQFSGVMDNMKYGVGEAAEISVHLSSGGDDWGTNNERRYNSVDQRSRFPDDAGLDFVEAIANQEHKWGRV